MIQNSYNTKSKLYLIPTPIGNLDDITIRSIKTLNEVEVIFSEDTRITMNLLNHFEIKGKKIISSHEHNEIKNIDLALEYLKSGKNIAIVTDRGTPLISDPGYLIVKKVIEKDFNVISLPGATAFVPALTASGISAEKFAFYGFLNSKSKKRLEELETLKNYRETLIFYEAPHRIKETLNAMLKILGNRKISISREITKKYEEIIRGTIDECINNLENIKGEFVIIVSGNDKSAEKEIELSIIKHVNLYLKEGLTEMEAFKKVAKERKISKSEVYKEYQGVKK